MKTHYEIESKVTHKYVEKVCCDICGEDTTRTSFSHDGIKLQKKEGSVYPEGGLVEVELYDICEACYKGKVKPFFNSLGANPTKYDIDY
jgi:hypothetical protein